MAARHSWRRPYLVGIGSDLSITHGHFLLSPGLASGLFLRPSYRGSAPLALYMSWPSPRPAPKAPGNAKAPVEKSRGLPLPSGLFLRSARHRKIRNQIHERELELLARRAPVYPCAPSAPSGETWPRPNGAGPFSPLATKRASTSSPGQIYESSPVLRALSNRSHFSPRLSR